MAKEKNTTIDGLKKITKWLTFGNLNEKALEKIIEDYKFTSSIITPRLFSFIYNYPNIVIYLNKYINTQNISSADVKDVIMMFGKLFSEKRIGPKDIIYLKTDYEKINKIKLLREHLNSICLTNFNNAELNFFYLLSNKLNIPIEIVEKETIDNKFKTPKSTIVQKNQDIINFSNSIKELKKHRELCRTCPLYNQPIVTFDTNAEHLGDPVDVIFIALNPGAKEKEVGIPLVGPAGKIFRKQLEEKINGKWLITNIILCHTANEAEMKKIGVPKDIAGHCNELVNEIVSNFPSKIYVPLGKVSAAMMGLENYKNGTVYPMDGGIYIIPVLHPSALNYGSSQKKKDEFESQFISIRNTIESLKEQNVSSGNEETITIDEEWTLFDTCELDNQILLIYIDKEGNKKYIKKPLEIKVLMNNSEWNKLSMLTSTIHQSYSANAFEKNILSASARNQLNKIKRI